MVSVFLFAMFILPFNEEGNIKIDGRLNEGAWENAWHSTGFIQYEPEYQKEISYPAEVNVFFTREALFIGICVHIPKDKQYASNVWKDYFNVNNISKIEDGAMILIDPHNRGSSFYCFGMNLIGTKTDGRGGEEMMDYGWDGKWEGGVSSSQNMWCAEFKVPFTTLNISPGGEKVIKMKFIITLYTNREIALMFDTEDIFSIARAGEFELGIRERRRIFVYTLPYGSYRYEDGEGKIDGGVDFGIKLPDKLQVDFTVNPDYCEVEPDVGMVPLSKGVEIFYPEKRKFFMEGNHLYSWNLFYSRRIEDIDYAVKGYGTLWGSEMNMMYISTPEGSGAKHWGVVALEKKVGSFLGNFTGVYRDGYKVIGLEGKYRVSKSLSFDFTGRNCLSDSFSADEGRYLSISGFFRRGSKSGMLSISRERKHSLPETGFMGSVVSQDINSMSAFYTFREKWLNKLDGKSRLSVGYSIYDSLKCAEYSVNLSQSFIFSSAFLSLRVSKSYDRYWDWEQEYAQVFVNYGKMRKIFLNFRFGKGNGSPLYSCSIGSEIYLKERGEIFFQGSLLRSEAIGNEAIFIGNITSKINITKNLFIREFIQYSSYYQDLTLNGVLGLSLWKFDIYLVGYEVRSVPEYTQEVRRMFVKMVLKEGRKL